MHAIWGIFTSVRAVRATAMNIADWRKIKHELNLAGPALQFEKPGQIGGERFRRFPVRPAGPVNHGPENASGDERSVQIETRFVLADPRVLLPLQQQFLDLRLQFDFEHGPRLLVGGRSMDEQSILKLAEGEDQTAKPFRRQSGFVRELLELMPKAVPDRSTEQIELVVMMGVENAPVDRSLVGNLLHCDGRQVLLLEQVGCLLRDQFSSTHNTRIEVRGCLHLLQQKPLIDLDRFAHRNRWRPWSLAAPALESRQPGAGIRNQWWSSRSHHQLGQKRKV